MVGVSFATIYEKNRILFCLFRSFANEKKIILFELQSSKKQETRMPKR